MKTVVLLMMGLPGSGKSSLAQKLQDVLDNHERRRRQQRPWNVIYIEYDAIEQALLELTQNQQAVSHEQQQEEVQRLAWNQARETALRKLQDALAASSCSNIQEEHEEDGKNNRNLLILLDDNFHLRSMRKQIHRMLLRNYHHNSSSEFNRHDTHRDDVEANHENIFASSSSPFSLTSIIHFGIVWVDCDLETCLKRNSERSQHRRVPDHVLYNMAKSFEEPRESWELPNSIQVKVSSTSSVSSLDDILDFIEHCPIIVDTDQEERQKAVDRAKTLSNRIHKYDQLLRSWVGQIAKVEKRYGKLANAARKELMQQLKRGDSVLFVEKDCYGSVEDSDDDDVVDDNPDSRLGLLQTGFIGILMTLASKEGFEADIEVIWNKLLATQNS